MYLCKEITSFSGNVPSKEGKKSIMKRYETLKEIE